MILCTSYGCLAASATVVRSKAANAFRKMVAILEKVLDRMHIDLASPYMLGTCTACMFKLRHVECA